MPTLTLPVPREFSFDECLRYLGRSTSESLHTVEGHSVKKLIRGLGAPVFTHLQTTSPDAIEVTYQQKIPTVERSRENAGEEGNYSTFTAVPLALTMSIPPSLPTVS